MKKILSILSGLVLGISALVVCSCNPEDFLNTQRTDGAISTDQLFSSEENAEKALNAVYAMMNPDNDSWGLRLTLLSCCSTLDVQAVGPDACWNDLTYTADNKDITDAWAHCYKAVYLANNFLANLENSSSDALPEGTKNVLKGEALALRGFFMNFLASNFGLVPLLEPGETFMTTPDKGNTLSYDELWNAIISDFEAAAANLEWQPYNGEYGRCTKGMALAYLAQALMYKAHFCRDTEADCYIRAYECNMQVIRSNTYELLPCYSNAWDYEGLWQNETIWSTFVENDQWTKLVAPARLGGSGIFSLSWEWYGCYETYLDGQYAGSFDKRRDYSCCFGDIPDKSRLMKEHPEFQPQGQGHIPSGFPRPDPTENFYYGTIWGQNPFTNERLEADTTAHVATPQNSYATPIWTTKYWRTGKVGDSNRTILAWMRYSDVCLNAAECCFHTNKDAEGWSYIEMIRQRAFGNLEIGKEEYLNSYLVHLNRKRASYGYGIADSYPGARFNMCSVVFPPAQEYYSKIKAEYGFKSDIRLIALGIERAKEFSCEPGLREALIRSGFLEDYVNTIYPKSALPLDETYVNEWKTARHWDFNSEKVFWPIPSAELELNQMMTE